MYIYRSDYRPKNNLCSFVFLLAMFSDTKKKFHNVICMKICIYMYMYVWLWVIQGEKKIASKAVDFMMWLHLRSVYTSIFPSEYISSQVCFVEVFPQTSVIHQ